jgi:hypothetical protein
MTASLSPLELPQPRPPVLCWWVPFPELHEFLWLANDAWSGLVATLVSVSCLGFRHSLGLASVGRVALAALW